jgi:hypothetical protein
VPFLKFSRDKRGYENYYLFDGKGRPRLLFFFRTPPQMKIGRTPFSADVRQMVEAQNPGVQFDWARIMATPIPSPDIDRWRERRRIEKAAKRAAREADAAEAAEAAAEAAAAGGDAAPETAAAETEPREDVEAVMDAAEGTAESHETNDESDASDANDDTVTEGDSAAETPTSSSDVQVAQPAGHRRRRRRRRGRRGGGGVQGGGPVSGGNNEV